MNFCCRVDGPVFPVLSDATESHANFNLINNRFCGKSSPADRIVGGSLAVVNQFPWLVLLEYRSKDDEKKQSFKCGGTLISEKYVLTGKHSQS